MIIYLLVTYILDPKSASKLLLLVANVPGCVIPMLLHNLGALFEVS